MKTSGNTVLITGGATGIGLALAEAFITAGNKVLICGRRKNKLDDAWKKLPQIQVRQCDVSKKEQIDSLYDWIKNSYPDLNILVNNAGISRSIDLKQGPAELYGSQDEIEINLVAPIRLSAYFIPLLREKKEAAIVNVSGGLAFVPLAGVPLYSASKAGLHSFTLSLRHQLRGTSVKVFEIFPPIVETDLGKGTTDHKILAPRGIPPSELAAAAMKGLERDEYEIIVGEARRFKEESQKDFETVFQELNPT